MKSKTVAIDCFIDNPPDYTKNCAVVVVDVIRSTTVQVTAVASGRRCFFAQSVEHALLLASQFENPLLVGEVGGNMPYGFDMNNSPVEIEQRRDTIRPAIVLSSSGTRLLHGLNWHKSVYISCLRNYSATKKFLVGRYNHVALIGAPTRGEFREEDRLCCAWIADGLIKAGYNEADSKTEEILNDWRHRKVEACTKGKSAEYLRNSGQKKDLDFIVSHIDDLNFVCTTRGNEILKVA